MRSLHTSLLRALTRVLAALHFLPGRARLCRVLALGARCQELQVTVAGLAFRLDPSDGYQAMMAVGRYEAGTVDLLGRALRVGDTFVDVGAEIGFFASHAAAQVGEAGKILLFEPDPRALTVLRANAQSMRDTVGVDVQIIEAACSDSSRLCQMTLTERLGHSSLERPGGEQGMMKMTAVNTVTLDSQLAAIGRPQIRALKMDIEGHEIAALRGMSESLAAGLIDLLIIEKNLAMLEQSGYSENHLHSFMISHGYEGFGQDGNYVRRAALCKRAVENLFYVLKRSDVLALFSSSARPEEAGDQRIAVDLREIWDPTCAQVQTRLAIRQVRDGDLAGGAARAEQVLKRFPGELDLRGHLAHWCVVLGDTSRARTHYEVLLQYDPANNGARQLLAKLE